jgi:hypothetical protein
MKNLRKISILIIPIIVFLFGYCKGLPKIPGMKDAKTEKQLKESTDLLYALLDAVPEAEKFMADNKDTEGKELDKKAVNKISGGLKKLEKIKDPDAALKEGKKLFDNMKGLSTRAIGGDVKLVPYTGDIATLVGQFPRLWDEKDKLTENVKNGGKVSEAWNDFLADKGLKAGKKGKKDKKAKKTKKTKKKKKKKR